MSSTSGKGLRWNQDVCNIRLALKQVKGKKKSNPMLSYGDRVVARSER